jgi:hypothetical protein
MIKYVATGMGLAAAACLFIYLVTLALGIAGFVMSLLVLGGGAIGAMFWADKN